jgi:hypothetical protein
MSSSRLSHNRLTMTAITINLDELAVQAVAEYAQRTGRTTDEVIAEAIDHFRMTRWRPRHSLRDFKPLGLKLTHPDAWKVDDILDEMINHDRD